MGLNRRAAKRDTNEAEIIQALRAGDASVEQLSQKGVPDLLVGFTEPGTGAPRNVLMEVKGRKGKLTPDEQTWFKTWCGQAVVDRTVEEALEVINGK